jgi:hypothetical protein
MRVQASVSCWGRSLDHLSRGRTVGRAARSIFEAVQLDIAGSTRVVAWIMAVGFVVAAIWLKAGTGEEAVETASS